MLLGGVDGARLGASLIACDVDGDGRDELFVGAPGSLPPDPARVQGLVMRVAVTRDVLSATPLRGSRPGLGSVLAALRDEDGACVIAAATLSETGGGVELTRPGVGAEWVGVQAPPEALALGAAVVADEVDAHRRFLVSFAARRADGWLGLGLLGVAPDGRVDVLLAPHGGALPGSEVTPFPLAAGGGTLLGLPTLDRLARQGVDGRVHQLWAHDGVARAAAVIVQGPLPGSVLVSTPLHSAAEDGVGRVDLLDLSGGEPRLLSSLLGDRFDERLGETLASGRRAEDSVAVALSRARGAEVSVGVWGPAGWISGPGLPVPQGRVAPRLLWVELDGDGALDLVVGLPDHGAGGSGRGAVVVVFSAAG